jgi:hypothetical protein
MPHGGYDMHAVADYFPQVAEEPGTELGVDPARRFSGLSVYKRLIESGIEAIALKDLPHFFPEQVGAAVDAGLHAYMAKPVASDVPGVLSIRESAKRATARLSYWNKAYGRGGRHHMPGGAVENLYETGAVRNIATMADILKENRRLEVDLGGLQA